MASVLQSISEAQPELSTRGILREYPQSPPKFHDNRQFVRVSIVFAMRGGYELLGLTEGFLVCCGDNPGLYVGRSV